MWQWMPPLKHNVVTDGECKDILLRPNFTYFGCNCFVIMAVRNASRQYKGIHDLSIYHFRFLRLLNYTGGTSLKKNQRRFAEK